MYRQGCYMPTIADSAGGHITKKLLNQSFHEKQKCDLWVPKSDNLSILATRYNSKEHKNVLKKLNSWV